MTPVWQFAALTSLSFATLVMAWVSIQLSRRVGASQAVVDALTQRVDGLSVRLRSIETEKIKRTRDDSNRVDPQKDGNGIPSPTGRRHRTAADEGLLTHVVGPSSGLRPSSPRGRRTDPAGSLPAPFLSPGPTLITVPTLASPGSEAAATEAAEGLSRRFGAIWTLADSGASANAIASATRPTRSARLN